MEKNVSGDPALKRGHPLINVRLRIFSKKKKKFLTKRRMSKRAPDGFEPETP